MPKGRALSEATKEEIWELRAQGLSEREIGRQFGARRQHGNYLRPEPDSRADARRFPAGGRGMRNREPTQGGQRWT